MSSISNVNLLNQNIGIGGGSTLFFSNNPIDEQKTIILPSGFMRNANTTIKVVFKNGHNTINAITNMTLNGIAVCSNQQGELKPLKIHTMEEEGIDVYKVLSANVCLELYYDATGYEGNPCWIVIGNPIVLSGSGYTIYADGYCPQWSSVLDYANTRTVSNLVINNTWTADDDGLLSITGKCFGDSGVQVNGKNILYMGSQVGETVPEWSCQIPVKKGDTIRTYGFYNVGGAWACVAYITPYKQSF